MRELSRETESLRDKVGAIEAGSLTDKVKQINGISVVAAQVGASGMESLRSMVDQLKEKIKTGITVLASESEGKAQIVASVSPDLVAKGFHAGKIVKEAAAICEGGGGGRPDMAQAGGKNPQRIGEALLRAEQMIADWK